MTGQKAIEGAIRRLENRPNNDLSKEELQKFFAENQDKACLGWGQGYYDGWNQGK